MPAAVRQNVSWPDTSVWEAKANCGIEAAWEAKAKKTLSYPVLTGEECGLRYSCMELRALCGNSTLKESTT